MATIEISEATLGEWMSLLHAVQDSATPALAERIAAMLTTLGGLAAKLDDDTAAQLIDTTVMRAPELSATLETLAAWHHDGVWDALREMASIAAALKDSATPQLVERLAGLGVALGQVAGAVGPGLLATLTQLEEEAEPLSHMIAQLGEWWREGTWQTLVDLMSLVHAFRESMTPQLAERATVFVSQALVALRQAVDSGLLELGLATMNALQSAAKEAERPKGRITVTGLMRSLREPEIQYTTQLLLALMRRGPDIIKDITE
jgi:uncharacterized protein YjgD (DUF1641 family)